MGQLIPSGAENPGAVVGVCKANAGPGGVLYNIPAWDLSRRCVSIPLLRR